MNLEFAALQECSDDCDARIAANKAWLAHIDRLLEASSRADTPKGLIKVATDGERADGRLAWVPGVQ